jgi:hypothetical protein
MQECPHLAFLVSVVCRPVILVSQRYSLDWRNLYTFIFFDRLLNVISSYNRSKVWEITETLLSYFVLVLADSVVRRNYLE